jgi:hypothetical protein
MECELDAGFCEKYQFAIGLNALTLFTFAF